MTATLRKLIYNVKLRDGCVVDNKVISSQVYRTYTLYSMCDVLI